jgi:hypothetical protein
MSMLDDRYVDILGPEAPPDRQRFVADLDRVYAAWRLPTDRDEAIAHALRARAVARDRSARSRFCPSLTIVARSRQGSPFIAAATLAASLVLGGAYAVLHGRSAGMPHRPLSPSLTSTAYADPMGSPIQSRAAPATRASGVATGTPLPTGTPAATTTRVFSPSPAIRSMAGEQ